MYDSIQRVLSELNEDKYIQYWDHFKVKEFIENKKKQAEEERQQECLREEQKRKAQEEIDKIEEEMRQLKEL